MGRIQVAFPTGAQVFGSGAMISPYHFLTAGHVVHSSTKGGWATSMEIALGQDGDEKFYGVADWNYVRSYSGWTDDRSADHDWALVTLDRNLGNYTGWLGYESRADDEDYDGMTVNTAGYPSDRSTNGVDMYYTNGPTDHASTHRVYYSGEDGMDTYEGQSGSPVWRYISDSGMRYINAVHAKGGSTLNSGTRITGTKFNSLQSWKSTDDSVRPPTDRPDLVDYDEWFDTNYSHFTPTYANPGDYFNVRSVVRNNGTAAAGNFNVSFYASTNDYISNSDYLIGTTTISSLNPFSWAYADWSGTLSSAIPVGTYFVGWIIDSAGSQQEFLENNNKGLASGTLTVAAADDNYEENDSQATAYNLSNEAGTWLSSVAGYGIQSDDDWYQIQVAPGLEHVTVECLFDHAAGDIDIALYDASATRLASSTSTTDDELIEYDVLTGGGTYYVKVYYDDAGNSYNLRWDNTAPALPLSEIHGSKWHDQDGDGVWDASEPGLEGWKIYVDINRNGRWDSGEPFDETDAVGDYRITGLDAGTYRVGEVPQEGWWQTYPAAFESAQLRSDEGLTKSDDGSLFVPTLNPSTNHEPFSAPLVQDSGLTPRFTSEMATTAPVSFDLRTGGYVTSVKDQSSCGSCWSFATYGSLESSILMDGGSVEDFSENHLKNYHGFDIDPCDGGLHSFSQAYLTRGSGPVDESDDPYHPYDDRPSPGGAPQYYVRESLHLDTDAEIKDALTVHGALYTALYWDDAYFQAADATYYYDGTATSGNHAVTLVGWDDSKVTAASSPGAWLTRNSWGSSFGDDGYFWISYQDVLGGNWAVSFHDAATSDTFNNVYYHDEFGDVTQFSSSYAFNAFTPIADESLGAVQFWTHADGAGYEVRIYDTFAAGTLSGLLASETGTHAYAGQHTVDLSSLVPLTLGDTFYVYLNITNGGGYPMSIDVAYPGLYTSASTAQPGAELLQFERQQLDRHNDNRQFPS